MGKTPENTIELTDEFDYITAQGWRTRFFIIGDHNYISSGNPYYIEGDNIYFKEKLGETYLTGKITKNKIELKDPEGNVIGIFKKR